MNHYIVISIISDIRNPSLSHHFKINSYYSNGDSVKCYAYTNLVLNFWAQCNNTKNILFYSILRNEDKNRALRECDYSTNKKRSKSLIAATSYNRHNTITGSDPTYYVLHHVFHTWIESEPVAFFFC
jgi:hypothetical protein